MNYSHLNHVADARELTIGIVAPDGREGMLQHAQEFHDAGVPFIFDPGQGLPLFNGEELLDFLQLADYCCVNDYEARLLADKTGRPIAELAGMVRALIVTLGADGARNPRRGQRLDIPSVKPDELMVTRPAAAMPSAPACSMASPAAWAGTRRGAWPR
jgi:adenosine kinase